MVYILLLILIIFLIIAYNLDNKEIVSPSVLFTAGFTLMTFFAMLNQNKWSLQLDKNTFFLIVGGTFEFIAIAWIINIFFKKTTNNERTIILNGSKKGFIKEKYLYILGIVVFLNLIIIILEIRKATGISNPISAANYMNASSRKLNNTVALSGKASLLSIGNTATGIWAEYYFTKYFILRHRFNWNLFGIIFISIITPLFTGVRGGSFSLLISLFVFFFLIIKTISKKGDNRYLKYIGITILCMIILLIGLRWTATLVGRDVSQYTPFDYISIYLGAQLKNLSLFVQNGQFPVNNGIFGAYTFYSIIPSIANMIGIEIPRYLAYLPFQYVNGYNLGNVYTLYYPWLYDFGYIGMIIMTAVMSALSQIVYNLGKKGIKENKKSIFPLLYGYMSSFIFLAFFADGFIRQIGINLIYTIIVWCLLNVCFVIKNK